MNQPFWLQRCDRAGALAAQISFVANQHHSNNARAHTVRISATTKLRGIKAIRELTLSGRALPLLHAQTSKNAKRPSTTLASAP